MNFDTLSPSDIDITFFIALQMYSSSGFDISISAEYADFRRFAPFFFATY
jgi:hypothetical protein